MSKHSLPYRLTSLIVGVASMILVLLLVYNYLTTSRIMEQRVQESISTITGSAISLIDTRLEDIEVLARNYAALLINREFNNEEYIRILMEGLLEKDSLLSAVTLQVESQEGRIRYDFIREGGSFHRGAGEELMPWDGAFNKGEWTDPYPDSMTRQRVISLSFPLLELDPDRIRQVDPDRIRQVGRLTLHVPMTWINDIVNRIQVYESGEVFLLRGDGLFLTHPDEAKAGSWTLEDAAELSQSPSLISLLDSMVRKPEGYMALETYYEGRIRGILTYRKILQNDWYVVLLFKEAEYLREFNRLTRQLSVIGITALILLSVLIFLVIRRLTQPILQVTRLTEEMAAGAFDKAMPDISKGKEALSLSSSIRSLQSELQSYIARLKNTVREKERIESDIRIASKIQADLIPTTFPNPGELRGLEIFGKVIPARWVSGDLFTFQQVDEDHLVFMIGDVTGKGVPASLFMAITRTLVLIESRHRRAPASILEEVNKHLCQDNTQSVFVTAILGVIELSTGKLEYSNAGHLPPYIFGGKKGIRVEEKAHGVPLGLFESASYTSSTVHLGKGECFLCFSDGLPEAENKEGDFYGDERLEKVLQQFQGASPDAGTLVEQLIRSTDDFRGSRERSDDLTLLALSYNT
jgi:sigma-B regulation protein RsbU (phosphoserine phosphatase)